MRLGVGLLLVRSDVLGNEASENRNGILREKGYKILFSRSKRQSVPMETQDNTLIKIDLLSVECLDKIHNCLDLLVQYGKVSAEPTLKETYEKVIGIYNIERTAPKMWEMVNTHQIHSLFQMEQQSGIQGISAIHPQNINDLTVLNSVIRLMAPEKGGEQPLQTWARYRSDISEWYKEMALYGLTSDEMKWLASSDAATDGIVESQEGLMLLVQEPRLGGNSLTFADKCRKGIAKKQGSLFEECEKEFFENVRKKGCSEKLAHYVWDVLLKVQRGYSFNRSHCLAYSLIALQEMNLCYHFPIIYWNCACLITDSGGSNDYAKLAQALGKMISSGVKIVPPDINQSSYTFSPDEENNQIYFGLRGITNVGEELIERIFANRPYNSIKEFLEKVNPNKQAIVALLKGGAFDNIESNRQGAMVEYLWLTCDKKSRLTLQNIPTLIKYNLIPDEEPYILTKRIYEFNRYLKSVCKTSADTYTLDDRAIDFLNEIDYHSFDSNILNAKVWDKAYQSYMDVFRDWIKENKDELLDALNTEIFMEAWEKYAGGNLSSWEMESLCFYYHEHELAHINKEQYQIVDFGELPETPVVSYTLKKGDARIPLYKLSRICGTCLAKDKAKSTIYLLTTDGVVTIRFNKEHFSLFDKQISKINADGTKSIEERSWFNRGSLLVIQGYRRGDQFVPKKYANSLVKHQLYKIDEIKEDGSLVLRGERAKGESEDD